MIAVATENSGIVPVVVALLALLFPGGVIAFFKLRPERRALVITEVQGATTILNGVIEALEGQHDRDQLEIERLRRKVEEQAEELADLRGRTLP